MRQDNANYLSISEENKRLAKEEKRKMSFSYAEGDRTYFEAISFESNERFSGRIKVSFYSSLLFVFGCDYITEHHFSIINLRKYISAHFFVESRKLSHNILPNI